MYTNNLNFKYECIFYEQICYFKLLKTATNYSFFFISNLSKLIFVFKQNHI